MVLAPTTDRAYKSPPFPTIRLTLLLLKTLLLVIPFMPCLSYSQSITTTLVDKIESTQSANQTNEKSYIITIKFEVNNITQSQVNLLSKDSSYKIRYDSKTQSADIFWIGKITSSISEKELKESIEKKPDEFESRILEKIRTGRVK